MTALLIILTIMLVPVNASVVVGEYALVRSRKGRLEEMAEEGNRGARRAVMMSDELGDYIAACQIGITMASLGIGALGEPTISHALEHAFGGSLGHAAALVISVILSYLLITVFQSIVGEIAPKLYTIPHAEPVACAPARPLHVSRVLFSPFIVVLTAASNWLVRLTGTDPDAEPEGGTPDDIKRIIADSRSGGSLDAGAGRTLARGL